MSGTLFKWVGNSRIYEIFNTITQFGLFPKTIYSRAFQNLLTYFIPVAMLTVLKGINRRAFFSGGSAWSFSLPPGCSVCHAEDYSVPEVDCIDVNRGCGVGETYIHYKRGGSFLEAVKSIFHKP